MATRNKQNGPQRQQGQGVGRDPSEFSLTLYMLIFSGNKNIYLHFMSFLHIDMTQVVEILLQVRQELTYST